MIVVTLTEFKTVFYFKYKYFGTKSLSKVQRNICNVM